VTDAPSPLHDAFGRRLTYLRLSVTERCNFTCEYCLPDGCRAGGAAPLTVAEIERLLAAFAGLGVWKVRLTGGEPTLRHDLPAIVQAVAATPGVRRVGLTTNGLRLRSLAGTLRGAGLTSLNVSVDSLDPARFAAITGVDALGEVVAGVDAALATALPSVKVNAVLLRGLGEAELDRFLAWTRALPLTVRFIELMRTGQNGAYFERNHLPAAELRDELARRGWVEVPRDETDGPATNYAHPDFAGRIGVIAPYAAGFCETCNRLRVSATGALRLCLFGERDDVPLRHLLRSASQRQELVDLIAAAVARKPRAHHLAEGSSGSLGSLAVIGG
jgi:cyclic pyranopterin phosphate synthase